MDILIRDARLKCSGCGHQTERICPAGTGFPGLEDNELRLAVWGRGYCSDVLIAGLPRIVAHYEPGHSTTFAARTKLEDVLPDILRNQKNMEYEIKY